MQQKYAAVMPLDDAIAAIDAVQARAR
jgi:maleamate amidohydrolase